MATTAEVNEAVKTVRATGLQKIILLKCTSSYPAKEEDYNLLTIPYMRKKFKCSVGVSDHTLGTAVPTASVAHGAVMIEKHLKFDENSSSADSKFSMEPGNFKKMVDEVNLAFKANGKVYLGPTNREGISKKFRRSIIVIKGIKKNEKISKENIKILRPAIGISPKYYFKVLGKKVNKKMNIGDPLKFTHIKSI